MKSTLAKSILIMIFLLAFAADATYATFISSASDPALTGAAIIDFDSLSLGNFSTMTLGNVTFSDAGTGDLRIADYTEGGVFGTTGHELSTRYAQGSFNIDFTSAVSAFGMIWGAADGAWTMKLFNSSNTLLDTIAIAAQTSPYIGFIGASDNLISHVEMVGAYADWVKIDNFAYVTGQPIPEPATMFLLGSGLVGIAGFRRKNRK